MDEGLDVGVHTGDPSCSADRGGRVVSRASPAAWWGSDVQQVLGCSSGQDARLAGVRGSSLGGSGMQALVRPLSRHGAPSVIPCVAQI